MTKSHFHFDHVGSYLRPQELKEARENYSEGKISQEELLKVQDKLVKKLVQHEVEMTRKWFQMADLGGGILIFLESIRTRSLFSG